jgi:hypothetical protein
MGRGYHIVPESGWKKKTAMGTYQDLYCNKNSTADDALQRVTTSSLSPVAGWVIQVSYFMSYQLTRPMNLWHCSVLS